MNKVLVETQMNFGDAINAITDRSDLSDIRNLCEVRILWLRGYADGKAAGTWVFDGNMAQESIEIFQQKIRDGDPEAMEALPQPRIGGEFADDPTWADILKDEVEWDIDDPESSQRDDLLDAYEEGFTDGVNDEVMSYGKD